MIELVVGVCVCVCVCVCERERERGREIKEWMGEGLTTAITTPRMVCEKFRAFDSMKASHSWMCSRQKSSRRSYEGGRRRQRQRRSLPFPTISQNDIRDLTSRWVCSGREGDRIGHLPAGMATSKHIPVTAPGMHWRAPFAPPRSRVAGRGSPGCLRARVRPGCDQISAMRKHTGSDANRKGFSVCRGQSDTRVPAKYGDAGP
eukprot:COSAG01_NODE_8365_length_2813_cov_1.606853_4_plen_203_part_00